MRPPLAVSAFVTVASFLVVCPLARSFGPDPEPAKKLGPLRHEIRELDASLVTIISQAENSISDDVETVHACILAEHAESVDTRAAYIEAKSLINDLDALRQHAIADLPLPDGYTPPTVASASLPSPMTDIKPALKAAYQDITTATRLITTDITAEALDLETRLEVISNEENVSGPHMFRLQIMLNQVTQLSDAVAGIMSASNSAIANMARNEN